MLSNRPSALRAALAIALLAVLVGAGAWMTWRMGDSEWTDSSLSALIPAENANPAAERALAVFTQRIERQVVLVVRHADRDMALRAADRLVAALSQWPSLGRVRGRIPPEQQAAWVTFYAPYRQQLLSSEARRLLEQHQGDDWRKQALALAYSPFAGVSGGELAADPFLLQRHFLLERAASASPAETQDGWQIRQDSSGAWHVLVTAELAIDPFGIGGAEEWTAQVDALEAKIATEVPGTTLLRHGAVFYSAEGSRQAQFEVSTIGLGSMIGVMLLNILVFRHWVPFGLTLLSVAGGMIAAISATLWLTGPLHVFTLVFGSTLIGVTEDYSCHFLCHELDARAQGVDDRSTLQRIFPAMAMSLATTLLAYAALLLAPFPVLRQLTVFSIAGVGTSFVMVILWFPYFTRKLSPRPLPGSGTAGGWLSAWDRTSPARRWWPTLLVTMVSLPFLFTLHVDDDVHQLQRLDPGLRRQEARIASLFGTDNSSALLLVHAATPEAALQHMEAATTRLDTAIAQRELSSYIAVSAFVPSPERQQKDFALVRDELHPLVSQQSAALGLPGESARRFAREAFHPLTFEAWLKSPVSDGIRLLWQSAGADGVFAAVPLRGVVDSEGLRRQMTGLEGVTYVNKADEVSSHFQTYRVRITWMLVLAAVITYGVLVWRYGWRVALRVQAPCMASALCALAVLRITGMPVNLFTVLALLLVLGMGIDYALFFVESHHDAETTLLSIAIAAATTILSFGLLAFSSTAAIANFGVVVFTGVTVSFLLAALAMPRRI